MATDIPTTRQRLLTRYLTALLADLIVINMIAEFWTRVSVENFSTSLIAAVLLQLLLQATLALEHRIGAWFDKRSGGVWTFLRYLSAWFILFGSKFVMLGAVDRVLGDSIHFAGAMHGVLAFIAVVAGMLIAEQLVTSVYKRLA